MRFFGKKKKDDEFLDLTKEPLPSSPLDTTGSSLSPDNTQAKLDLINTRLQNIEEKLNRIEALLSRQPGPPKEPPIKW